MNRTLIQLAQKIRDGLDEYVARFRPSHIDSDLMGACAIASYFLMREARKKGIKVELFVGVHNSCDIGQHVWICHDGFIVDITATQFGYDDKIYIAPESHEDYYIKYREDDALDEIKDWGEQSPWSYHSYWRNGKFFIRRRKKPKK